MYDTATTLEPEAFAPATSPRDRIDPASADLLFREGRTAYSFTGQPVPDAVLAELYDLVRMAPTAMNSQPLRITFVRTDEAKARLLPHLATGNRAKSQSAPVVAILAYDADFHDELPRLLPHAPGARAAFEDEARREAAARFNATLQAGYFVLAARAVGLDAGPMGGFDADGVDAEFHASTAHRALLIVNLGHVADGGTFPRGPRLHQDEAVTFA